MDTCLLANLQWWRPYLINGLTPDPVNRNEQLTNPMHPNIRIAGSGRISGLGVFFKNVGAALLLANLCVSFVSADSVFGVHAGTSVWKPDVDGSVGQTNNAFDLNSEFSDSSADSTTLYVAVEHFIPLVPNAMVKRTPVSWSGSSSSASGTLGGITLSGAVDAEIDLTMNDLTLYYQLLDNWVSIDFGLTARVLDGYISAEEVTIADVATAQSERVEADSVIPMLYGHARFDLPFTGLAAGVRGNVIGYDGNNLADLEAYLHLEVDLIPLLDFGIQGGLRRLSLDIEDLDDWNSDATIEGAFVGVTAHF